VRSSRSCISCWTSWQRGLVKRHWPDQLAGSCPFRPGGAHRRVHTDMAGEFFKGMCDGNHAPGLLIA